MRKQEFDRLTEGQQIAVLEAEYKAAFRKRDAAEAALQKADDRLRAAYRSRSFTEAENRALWGDR